ncbi:MAG TPA: hypothetical protein VF062_13645 [Candidatus Limnocylindrales bacterium]
MADLLVKAPALAPVVWREVGERTVAAVSRMSAMGTVSRGTCPRAKGTKGCLRDGCQAPAGHGNAGRDCADLNMTAVLAALGAGTHLIIGCSSGAVGFHDTADPALIRPRRGGFSEIVPDFAAFFASEDEGVALVTHMADCGFLAVEMPGAYGFLHLTRTNMSCAPLLRAAEHYGCRVADLRLRLVAAVSAANFPQRFIDADGARPEDRFPGWFAEGLLHNRSRPAWEPGDPIDPADQWEADARSMMIHQILAAGVELSQLDTTDVIDPGDLQLGHASHCAAMRGLSPAGRDAYAVMPLPARPNR